MTESPEQITRRVKETCYTDATTKRTLTMLAGVDDGGAEALLKGHLDGLAEEATGADTLARLMLNIHRRDHVLELMQPLLRAEGAPASAFTGARMLLKDQDDAWHRLDALREKAGRNRCVPAEQAAAERQEAKEREERLWQHREMMRDKGYYYVPGLDLEQPECNLDPETVALRDVVRMRHLPQSPYEDRILAEEYDALFDFEKAIDKEKLSKKPTPADAPRPDPRAAEREGRASGSFDRNPVLAKLTIERTRAWNAARASAEAKVEAVDRAHGRPWVCACCHEENRYPLAEGWVDEPKGTVDSQWVGKFTKVVVAMLLWGVTLGWLFTTLIVGLPPLSPPGKGAGGRGTLSSSPVWCMALPAWGATALPPFRLDVPAGVPAKPCVRTDAPEEHDFAGVLRDSNDPERTQSRGTATVTAHVPDTLTREHPPRDHPPPDPFFLVVSPGFLA